MISGGSVGLVVQVATNYDRLGWLVVTVALLLALVTGLWRLRSRGLFASIVMFGALALALIAAALTTAHIPTFLFGTFDASNAQADDSWKAAQTIVLTLGFVGVVITGVLGYHRQRTSQEQLALERRSRQHERYAKGSEMLASDSPEMRIAGLNVIATLGAEVTLDDELRQTCVNLICAYLRKNSPADRAGPVPSKRSARAKRAEKMRDFDTYKVVAEEACRLLPSLFATAPAGRRRFKIRPWRRRRQADGLDLDLRRADLTDLNMSNRVIGNARFGGVVFSGDAGFGGATFSGDAGFGGVVFSGDAGFGGATFSGDAGFGGATFSEDAWFGGATFSGDAWFGGATFSGDARFGERFSGLSGGSGAGLGEAMFKSDAEFGVRMFMRDTWFGGATFSGITRFDGATFSGDAGFDGATFSGHVAFSGATFSGHVTFSGATFSGPAGFSGATFSQGTPSLERRRSGVGGDDSRK